MDFDTALEGYWLARRRDFSQNTINDYERTFMRFAKWIGKKLLAEITSTDIHKFLNMMQKKYKLSNKSLANVWIALSSFWTWAESEFRIDHVIRGAVSRPQYRRAPIEPYSESDIKAMLAACTYAAGWNTNRRKRARAMRPTAGRDRAIIIVLLDTGLRVSELCALTLRDCEPNNGRLAVQHGKGNKKRTVYLGNSGTRVLWRYLANRPEAKTDDPLFVTRENTAMDRNNVRHLIQRIARRGGVSHATVHRFRHTFAINFLRNGGNVLELQKLLGHEKMETIRIYADLAQIDLANAQRRASPADHWKL